MKKPFLFALGLVAVTVAACGGKVVVESSGASGTGGSGGTSTTLTTADGAPDPVTTVGVVTVGSSVVAASSSVTTGTGTSVCDPSYACAQALDPGIGDPSKLCDGSVHAKLYDALVQCICVNTCQVECTGSVCTSGTPSAACSACIQSTMNGCGNQLNACANDI